MPRNDLHQRLWEQVGFLRQSLERFYKGDIAEAIQIATRLRILVHETGNSKPLLKQLNRNYLEMKILGKPRPPKGQQTLMWCSATIKIVEGGPMPAFDVKSYSGRLMSLGEWWGSVCLILAEGGVPRDYERRYLILTMADKEGGAHVDPELPAEYVRLRDEFPLVVGWSKEEAKPLNLIRYVVGESGSEMLECLECNFTWLVA